MKPLPELIRVKQSAGHGAVAALVFCVGRRLRAAARRVPPPPRRRRKPPSRIRRPTSWCRARWTPSCSPCSRAQGPRADPDRRVTSGAAGRRKDGGCSPHGGRAGQRVHGQTLRSELPPALIINQGTAGARRRGPRAVRHRLGEADGGLRRLPLGQAGSGAGSTCLAAPMPHRLRLDGKDRVAFDRFRRPPRSRRPQDPNPRGRVVKGIVGSAFEFIARSIASSG